MIDVKQIIAESMQQNSSHSSHATELLFSFAKEHKLGGVRADQFNGRGKDEFAKDFDKAKAAKAVSVFFDDTKGYIIHEDSIYTIDIRSHAIGKANKFDLNKLKNEIGNSVYELSALK